MNKTFIDIGIFVASWMALLFLRHELLISLLIVIAIGLSFWNHYEKKEGLLLGLGVMFGLVLEIGSDQFYQLQYWDSGLVFGYPLWLFLFWGYAFVLIRRVGNLIVKQ